MKRVLVEDPDLIDAILKTKGVWAGVQINGQGQITAEDWVIRALRHEDPLTSAEWPVSEDHDIIFRQIIREMEAEQEEEEQPPVKKTICRRILDWFKSLW